MPLIVPCTQRAPARTAATAAAVARPKSLWPWKCTGTSGPTHSTVRPTTSATAPLARPPAAVGPRLRRGNPERVDDGALLRARLDRALVDLLVEVRLGAGRVDAKERRVDPVLDREAHRGRDPVEHLLARDADRLELQVRDRRFDHRRAHAQLDQRFQVGGHGAGESPDLGIEPGVGDQLHGVPVVLRDPREAGLDPVDPEPVEQPRDLELLLRVEHDADRLLAVAERRVVETDRAAEAVAVVQLAGPDHPHTTPSGNDESFSSPSAVTRKLSSTRRPPPPSQ